MKNQDRGVALSSGHRVLIKASLNPSCNHYTIDCITSAEGEHVATAFDAYVIDFGDESHHNIQFVQLFPISDSPLPLSTFAPSCCLDGATHEQALVRAVEDYIRTNALMLERLTVRGAEG
jgi:hypothetical protein